MKLRGRNCGGGSIILVWLCCWKISTIVTLLRFGMYLGYMYILIRIMNLVLLIYGDVRPKCFHNIWLGSSPFIFIEVISLLGHAKLW